ncbi:hypothetical protein XELAEV_18024661mg [Xenopus laevis]|uniref:Uncharacterized protein n=1 Tax=Xenopus laevis TaxID=8355 RepID=A0A974CY48_XENLA|nr:hypothetical protein XELAEV_18024661mg [Xenopus laevis]
MCLAQIMMEEADYLLNAWPKHSYSKIWFLLCFKLDASFLYTRYQIMPWTAANRNALACDPGFQPLFRNLGNYVTAPSCKMA